MGQGFGNNILDLSKQKDFILMSVWAILKILKNNCLANKGLIVTKIWTYS